jgi:ABC-type multidrug transport system ATPase subunit
VTSIALLLVGIRLFVLEDVSVPFVGGWQPIAALVFGAAARSASAIIEVLRHETEFRTLAYTRNLVVEHAGKEGIDGETIAQHARAVREQDRFSRNLGTTFELKFISLAGAGIFRDLTWTLEPGVNVLLGRNGYGKSFLLRILVSLVSNDAERLNQLIPPGGSQRMLLSLLRSGEPATIERQGARIETEEGKIPLLAIPDSRFITRGRASVGADESDFADLARFGAHHFLRDLSYDATINTVLAEMCIEALRANPGGNEPSTPQLDLVGRLVRELSGEAFRFFSIEPAGSARFNILVETDASPGQPIPIQQASQGTLSVVAICALIYQFLRRAHPKSALEELCSKPGLVVIDEIDAHLHPAWQRKIVKLLRGYFPKVQFILTAHSPLIVAGCGPGEISVLRREGGTLDVREFQRDFIGAKPEDIYREVFEIAERDDVFYGLQAQLPELPRLQLELESLRKSGAPSESILSKAQTVDAIVRTREDERLRIEVDAMRRENEQLIRQIGALREKVEREV